MGWRNIAGFLGLKPKRPEAVDGNGDQQASHDVIYKPPLSTDPDWIAAKRHINKRIEANHRLLEQPGLSMEQTEGCRLAIIELKGVLNFQNPSKMAQSNAG